MTHRMKALRAVLVLAVLGLASSTTLAAKPPSLYMQFQDGVTNTYRVVEQQSPLNPWPGDACNTIAVYEGVVCNYTEDPLRPGQKCLWDVDDHTGIYFHGSFIPARTTVSLTKCAIWDHGWTFGIEGNEPLTYGISLDGYFALEDDNALCVGGVQVRSDSPLMQPIPNSDGGIGIPGSVTWYVRNDSDKAVHFGQRTNIAAGSGLMGMDTYDDRWCPSGFPLFNTGTKVPRTDVSIWWSK